MSEKIRNEGREFAQFVQSVPAEIRARRNATGRARAEAEHHEWQDYFRAGKCTICEGTLATFNVERPCLHWLLVPAGFTKHHFMDVARNFDMFQIQLFLRRVANEDGFARNINDLSNEGTGKVVELTIRWNEYDWAISCGEGDYLGHASASEESRRPHYHFQMRRKKQAFIRYNDFHIPLSASDIRTIEAMRAAPGFVRPQFAGGEGMNDLLNEETIEYIVKASEPVENESEAMVRLQSFIVADEGTTISGTNLAAIFDEAKAAGVSVTSLLPKLQNVSVETVVTPADGVVEQVPRSGGRGKRKNR